MKLAIALTVAVLLILASCSEEPNSAALDNWVTATSLKPPTVAYTPKPIISAREQTPGRWVWLPEKAEAKTLSLDQLLSELRKAKVLSPEPLVLFTFYHRKNRLKLITIKSRIADAMGCSSSSPCIEGTLRQLRQMEAFSASGP